MPTANTASPRSHPLVGEAFESGCRRRAEQEHGGEQPRTETRQRPSWSVIGVTVSTTDFPPPTLVWYCNTTYLPGGAPGNLVSNEAPKSLRAPKGSKGPRAFRTAASQADRLRAWRKTLAALSQLSP